MLTFLRAVSKSRGAILARAPSALSPATSTSPAIWQTMTACTDKGGKPAKPMTNVCESAKSNKGENSVTKEDEHVDECEQEKSSKDAPKCHDSREKFTQAQECEEDDQGEEETSCSESESESDSEEEMPTKECPEDNVKDDEKPPKVASQLCGCAAAAVTKAVADKAGKAVENKMEEVAKKVISGAPGPCTGKKKQSAEKAVEKRVEEVAKKVVSGASGPCAGKKKEAAEKAVEKKVEEVAKKVSSSAPRPCVPPKAKTQIKSKVSEHVKCCQVETGKGGAKDDTKAHIAKCKKMMQQKCDIGEQDQDVEVGENKLDPKNAPCACVKQALEKCKNDKAVKPKPKPANVKKSAEKPKPVKQPPTEEKIPSKANKKEPCPKPKVVSVKSDKSDKLDKKEPSTKPGKRPEKTGEKKPCAKPGKTDKPQNRKNPKDYKKKPTVVCK